MIGEANHSRTVVSAPRPPARSKSNHSPLLRGGDGGGAVYLVAGGRGAEAPVLLYYYLWLYSIITSILLYYCHWKCGDDKIYVGLL